MCYTVRVTSLPSPLFETHLSHPCKPRTEVNMWDICQNQDFHTLENSWIRTDKQTDKQTEKLQLTYRKKKRTTSQRTHWHKQKGCCLSHQKKPKTHYLIKFPILITIKSYPYISSNISSQPIPHDQHPHQQCLHWQLGQHSVIYTVSTYFLCLPRRRKANPENEKNMDLSAYLKWVGTDQPAFIGRLYFLILALIRRFGWKINRT